MEEHLALPVIIHLVFSFSQKAGTRLCFPPHVASYPQAAGRLSSHRLQLPPSYKLTRPGERKHSSVPYILTHRVTHTPVDTQNGARVRQHAGGTRGDLTVKWNGAFLWHPYLLLEWLSKHCNPNSGPCVCCLWPFFCFHRCLTSTTLQMYLFSLTCLLW